MFNVNRNTSDLTRYTESASIDSRLLRKAKTVELNESISKCSLKLRESLQSTTSEGWWVPISFYNKKNGNGRVYNKRLWENVIESQRDTWVGSPMLCDHPEGDSDGSPDRICGVWLDAKMDEPNHDNIGLVYGLLVPSGHLGDDLTDHLSKGLKVGTSSSGFGKLMSDGCTVDPDSYMIERLSDWVLNPSQGTFFSYQEDTDDIVNKSKTNIRESNNSNIKEKSVKDSKITKLEEKKFRRDMESFLESADNIKDPQERLEEFKEIKSYLEDGACPDLKEKIEQKIADEEAYIRQAIAEKMELKEELEIDSPKDLREKLTKIAEDVQILDKESKDWKAISEKLQKKYSEAKSELDSRHSNVFVEFQKNKITELEEYIESQNKKFEETIKKMTSSYQKVREDLEAKQAENGLLESQKKELESKCVELTENLNKETNKAKVFERSSAEIASKLNESNEKVKKLSELVNSQRQLLEKSVGTNSELVAINEKKSEQIRGLAKSVKKAETKIKESRKNSFNKKELNAVDSYFVSLYEKYGNDILPYEESLRECASLVEAKNYFFRNVLQNLTETKKIDRTRLPENMYFSSKEREDFIKGENKSSKKNPVDRLPEGWL